MHRKDRNSPTLRPDNGSKLYDAVQDIAEHRGHPARTAGSAFGGMLGGAIGSLAGVGGAVAGAAVGALIGASIGDLEDKR